MQINTLIQHLESLAPLRFAASWDNCGLQFGDPSDVCVGALVALNPSQAAIAEASRLGANLLVTHHPLLFKATKRIDTRHEPGAAIAALARAGITCYAAHTNLDATVSNHHLGRLLDLRLDHLLSEEGRDPWFKLITFVPAADAPRLRAALWEAGGGRLGLYDQTAFWHEGAGSFRPMEGAHPTVGTVGEHHQGLETRLELLVPSTVRKAVIHALLEEHPYETPAWDLVKLENGGEPFGMGLWGVQEESLSVRELTERIRVALKPRSLRLVGDADRLVRRVAVCSGSGGDLWEAAVRQGVEVLITGEVRYHAALEAQARGLTMIEAGHQATETPVVEWVGDYLRERVGEEVPIHAFAEPEPFEVLSL